MPSTSWQKQHSFIQHGCLFVVVGVPLFLFQLGWPVWLKLSLIALIWVLGIKIAVLLTNHYAKTMVRIFRFDHDLAVGVVNQALNKKYIRCYRKTEGDRVSFNFREQVMILTVEPFPLNLPIDDHIKETPATKVVLRGLNAKNQAFAQMLSEAINETAVARVSNKIKRF